MEVFLFPLVNVTLFPGTTKPLNVFEPRYITMIRDAVASRTPVVMGYIEDLSKVTPVRPGDIVPFVRDVAGYAYPQIIEERLNGSLLVFMQGQGKLRLGKVLERNASYIVCEASIITERTAVGTAFEAEFNSLHRVLTRWVQTHVPDPTQQDIFLKNLTSPEEIIGSFASYLVRDYDLQQVVLEYNDLNEKIQFLYRLMESNELTTL